MIVYTSLSDIIFLYQLVQAHPHNVLHFLVYQVEALHCTVWVAGTAIIVFNVIPFMVCLLTNQQVLMGSIIYNHCLVTN